MKIISGSIDLKKIDKSKALEHKNGALYYPILIMVNDEKDKYNNDCGIAEGQTKEERENKQKKKYIGNGKTVWEKNSTISTEVPKHNYSQTDDDLPF